MRLLNLKFPLPALQINNCIFHRVYIFQIGQTISRYFVCDVLGKSWIFIGWLKETTLVDYIGNKYFKRLQHVCGLLNYFSFFFLKFNDLD